MFHKSKLWVILILLLASILRFYQISENPRALYGDGLTLVYDAYSILQTGSDQKGNFLPLFFELGGSRPAGYIYATLPFVALFGPTPLAERFISVLSGIGIVFLLYLITSLLISKKAGLFVAFLAAINPWELSLSRGPFESHFALLLALLGIYSFLRGLKNNRWFLLFGLSFALTIQTYTTYLLTIPILTATLLAGLHFIWKKSFKNVYLIFSLFLLALSIILALQFTIGRGVEDRFSNINIFVNPDIRHTVSVKAKNDRLFSSLPTPISNSIHVPHTEVLSLLVQNYIANFNPTFLFLHGDGQVRHNPAEMGGFYWVEFIFMILGAIYLFKNRKKALLFLVGWSLIAPLPTSLIAGPHFLRSSLLLPPVLMLSGIGLFTILSFKKKKLILMLFLGVFTIQFFYFLDRFYTIAPQKHARFWSYPAKQAVEVILKNKDRYDYIIASNDIDNMEFAYPVYAKLDPKLVIEQNKSPFKLGEYNFFKYGNVYIGSLPHPRIMEFIKGLPGKVLYIGSDKEQSSLENYTMIRGFDNEADLIITNLPLELKVIP